MVDSSLVEFDWNKYIAACSDLDIDALKKKDNVFEEMSCTDIKIYTLENENRNLKQCVKVIGEQMNDLHKKLKEKEDLNLTKIEHLKKSHGCKTKDLLEVNNNLQLFIDEQESHIQKTQREKGGEDAEIVFNFTRSLKPFISQIKNLQDEKNRLTDSNLNLLNEIEIFKNTVKTIEKSIHENYVEKDEVVLLMKQKELLENEINSYKNTMRSSKLILADTSNYKNEIEILKKQLQDKNVEHHSSILNVNGELRSLKKKLRDTENKCTSLMYTPPKVRVRTIIDEDTERELDEARNEKLDLQLKFRKSKREDEEKIKSMEDNLQKYAELEKKLRDEILVSQNQIALLQQENINFQVLTNDYETKKQQLIVAEKALQQLKLDIKRQLSLHQEELKREVKHAIIDTEHKCSKMNFMSPSAKLQLLSVLKILKEIKQVKDNLSHKIQVMMKLVSSEFLHIQTQLTREVSEINKKSLTLAGRYHSEIQLRKKLHNELIELKGNIRVLCRVRPIIAEDGDENTNAIKFHEDDDGIVYVQNKSSQKEFQLDKVFQPNATQDEVFNDVRSLINSCLDGYNVCIFAYGQTGSGKTFTMEGTDAKPGINQRALHLLFQETTERTDWDFTILVSYMEIYNEMLRDLLSVDPTAKLEIKQCLKDIIVNVPGLTCVPVKSVKDVNDILGLGYHNRMTATTNMNKQSSRSHSILSITVLAKNNITNTSINGKLNLVDLAGSERVSKSGAAGLRMKEAQNINKSLSALGDVIHALKNKDKHIPYRNTKLTYLLQDSLGGDSKTLMVVQVSPVAVNVAETLCSLNFAQRVRAVELGKAVKRKEKKI